MRHDAAGHRREHVRHVQIVERDLAARDHGAADVLLGDRRDDDLGFLDLLRVSQTSPAGAPGCSEACVVLQPAQPIAAEVDRTSAINAFFIGEAPGRPLARSRTRPSSNR